MRSHTGGLLVLGKGAAFATSTKQKLNTQSSTKAELVGINDAQGLAVTDNVVYQDNQSLLKLEKHGKGSSGKRTRHINIWYFFVTDRMLNKELTVEYCPTKLMVADFYTKPLQGKLFRIFRNRILNLEEDPCLLATSVKNVEQSEDNTLAPKQDPSAQECVGQSGNKNSLGTSDADKTKSDEH
eukprot:4800967-Ditylum_brightwellii.AAC.1